jgi:hypothetical protein
MIRRPPGDAAGSVGSSAVEVDGSSASLFSQGVDTFRKSNPCHNFFGFFYHGRVPFRGEPRNDSRRARTRSTLGRPGPKDIRSAMGLRGNSDRFKYIGTRLIAEVGCEIKRIALEMSRPDRARPADPPDVEYDRRSTHLL